MASEAKEFSVDDSEPVELALLDPAERALIETALADADAGLWVDHLVIRGDLARMRAKVALGEAAERNASQS